MGQVTWSAYAAKAGLNQTLLTLGLSFSDTKYVSTRDAAALGGNHHWILATPTDGIKVSQYKKTWQRKRQSGYLICIEYVWKGRVIYKRVEPWVSYPSDVLVTQLMLLPREVK